jgi:chemotaxis protein methyltransferase CheR
MTPLSHLDFNNLSEIIQKRTGLLLNENRYADLLRALSTLQFGDLFNALLSVDTTHEVWQTVIQTVTIGETYFFRNKRHFDVLRSRLLPDLIARRRQNGQKYLRLWSVGCATGEEPYSLAMLLRDLLPDIDDWLITILGTDINLANLERAERGVYRARSFRTETPDLLQERWFREDEGNYVLDPTIRNMVNFKPLNLIEDVYPTYTGNTMNIDLVMCRNVTIYFQRVDTFRVIDQLYQAIARDGWLIVGHSEPQTEVYDAFTTRFLDGATFYQKVEIAQEKPISLNHPHPVAIPTSFSPPPPAPEPEEPPDYDAIWQQAKDAADHEDWGGALALLDRIGDVMQAPAHYLRALIKIHTGQPEAARDLLRRAIYCDSSFALAHYTLGDIYQQLRKPTEALRHWRQALESLDGLDAADRVPYEDDLTVEALCDLVSYQMTTVTDAKQ